MKTLISGLSCRGMIRTALMVLTLFLSINLFGREPILNECPVNIDYKVKRINIMFGVGAKYLYTYTISFKPNEVTQLDKQRTYSLESLFFVPGEVTCHYTTVSSDIQNGQTFKYSQFPITGHTVVKFSGYKGYPEDVNYHTPNGFVINMIGFTFKGEPNATWSEDHPTIEQVTRIDLGLPNPNFDAFIVKVFQIRFYLPWLLGIALLIFVLYCIIRRMIYIKRVKT